MTEGNVLEVKDIQKSFSGVQVLSGVDFTLRKGEVHAFCGENGAGKSTLMNIIDGVIPQDAGDIFIEGNKVTIKNPHEAQHLGIQFVHQEIALCSDVTVAENIFMAKINEAKSLQVNYKELYRKAEEVLKPLADIKPDMKVSDLNISNQQIVEIAKALSMQCKVLILDEPTAALSEAEANALFKIIKKLKKQGISIIYISHRMAEIFGECDRVTILRDGSCMGTYEVADVDERMIVNKMVGREIENIYPPKQLESEKSNEVLFEVKDFSDGNWFKDISFQLKKGEILGLAGLVGAGRSEVSQAICGLRHKSSGEVFYKNEKLKVNDYSDSIDHGIVYLTEDRKVEGLFLEMSIKENVSAMKLKNIEKNNILNDGLENKQAIEYIDLLGIKCRNKDQRVMTLSGGNQQKILISKLLTINPKIVFMDEPTRGIDVGAKSEIHKLLRELSKKGIGVIIISSELPEVIGMCDRVIVMHEGVIRGEVSEHHINEKEIIQFASGIQ